MKLVNYTNERFSEIVTEYFKKKPSSMRLGQLLCNNFVMGSWDELFYEENDGKAMEMFYEFVYK